VSVLDQYRASPNDRRSQLNRRWLGGVRFLRSFRGGPRLHPRPRPGVPGGVPWRGAVEVGKLLPPSGGPTQTKTTPRVVLRAVVGADGEAELGVAL
jgi:hypothetical protein